MVKSKEPRRNVYVGHRYVPMIMGQWDNSITYEGLSIVQHEGNSYTSRKHVPIGVDILNEEYWAVTGNYNAQVEYYRKEVERLKDDVVENSDLIEMNKNEIVNSENRTNTKIDNVQTNLNDYKEETNNKIINLNSDLSDSNENTEKKFKDINDVITHYDGEVNEVYANGSLTVNGDGSVEKPYNNLNSVFSYIKSLTDKASEGKWKIYVSGTFNDGYKILDLPNLREGLEIIGNVSSDGTPLTVFDGNGASRQMGLWFEPANSLSVKIENIIFKNYGTGVTSDDSETGYGVLMKDKGNMLIENCHFLDNYIGVGGINQNRTTVHHCLFERNNTGVVTQYNSTLTVGSTSNTDYRRNIFNENRYGVRVTRMSVAHVDYNTINTSTITGLSIDMASRANAYGNDFNENNQGVTVSGAGEWINNKNKFNGNYLDYQHYGVGRESRTHSSRTNVYFDYPPIKPSQDKFIVDTTTSTGKNLMTFPSVYSLSPQQLQGVGKRFKVKLVGKIFNPNNSSGRIYIRTVNTSDGGSYDDFGYLEFDSEMYLNNFEYEMESVNIDHNEQSTSNKQTFSNASDKYTRGRWTKQFNENKSIRLVATSDSDGVEIEILYAQLSISG